MHGNCWYKGAPSSDAALDSGFEWTTLASQFAVGCMCEVHALLTPATEKDVEHPHLAVWVQNNVQAAQKYLLTLLLPQNEANRSGQVC